MICVVLVHLGPSPGSIVPRQLLLESTADCEGIVHVGSFLESASTDENRVAAGRIFVVFRARNPADMIFGVVIPSELRIVLR